MQSVESSHCNAPQHTATHCNTLQRTATHCNALQHTAIRCNIMQRTATYCNNQTHYAMNFVTSNHQDLTFWEFVTATHCNTLQHTATIEQLMGLGFDRPQVHILKFQLATQFTMPNDYKVDFWENKTFSKVCSQLQLAWQVAFKILWVATVSRIDKVIGLFCKRAL